jgi:hypothetical protein
MNTRIDKPKAIRHMLHASIRMLINEEDPLATHLICQSCKKIISDYAVASGIDLQMSWTKSISADNHKEFFSRYRFIYNFLKQADNDHDDYVDVEGIFVANDITTLINCVNMIRLAGHSSSHVWIFLSFINVRYPAFLVDSDLRRYCAELSHDCSEDRSIILERSEVLRKPIQVSLQSVKRTRRSCI